MSVYAYMQQCLDMAIVLELLQFASRLLAVTRSMASLATNTDSCFMVRFLSTMHRYTLSFLLTAKHSICYLK